MTAFLGVAWLLAKASCSIGAAHLAVPHPASSIASANDCCSKMYRRMYTGIQACVPGTSVRYICPHIAEYWLPLFSMPLGSNWITVVLADAEDATVI